MFNEELKYRYINDQSLNFSDGFKSLLTQKFEKISRFEAELNKDVYDFSYYDIENYYKYLNCKSLYTLYGLTSLFRGYVDFCIKEGLVKDHQNHFNEMTQEKCRNNLNVFLSTNTVLSREQVLAYCEEIDNGCDKALLLGIFEGIYGSRCNELAELKKDDIKKDTREVVLCTGRTIKVSSELIRFLDISFKEEEYTVLDADSKLSSIKYSKDDIAEGYVIKRKRNAHSPNVKEARQRFIKLELKKVFNYFDLGMVMNLTKLRDSGKIDMIQRLAKDNGVTCHDILYNPNEFKKVKERYLFDGAPSILYNLYPDELAN